MNFYLFFRPIRRNELRLVARMLRRWFVANKDGKELMERDLGRRDFRLSFKTNAFRGDFSRPSPCIFSP